MPELLSKRAFADSIGVNEKSVRLAISRGDLVIGYDSTTGKIDAALAGQNVWVQKQEKGGVKAGVSRVKAIAKIEKQKRNISPHSGGGVANIKPKAPVVQDDEQEDEGESLEGYTIEELLDKIKITSNMDVKKAMKYREIVELGIAKLKLAREHAVLVPKVDVEKALFAIGRQLKNDIMTIPENCVDMLMAAPNRVEAVIILKRACTTVIDKYTQEESVFSVVSE